MLKLNAGLIANIHLMDPTAITGTLNRFPLVGGHELTGRMKRSLFFVVSSLGSES